VSHRKLTVLIGMPLTILINACWGVPGNGERERETRHHEDFIGIENHGELDVQVRQSDEFRVVVSIDSNLLDNVKTRVRDDRLVIDNNINFTDVVNGPHVIVEMPELTFVELSGSGDLDATSFDEGGTVRLELSGSGDLRFEGSSPRIDATVRGSGDLALSGTTDFLDVQVNGSGNVDARNLDAAEGRVRLDGSGDVSATVHGDVDAELNGSGDLDLFGDVDLKRSDEDGSGDIRVH
jgi:hypothetical protein